MSGKYGQEFLRYIEGKLRGNILKYIDISSLEGLLDIFGDNEEDEEQDWFWINVQIVVELDKDGTSNSYKYVSPFINNMEKYFKK